MQALAPFSVLEGDTILADFSLRHANKFFLNQVDLTQIHKGRVINHDGHPIRICTDYWNKHGAQALSRSSHVAAFVIASRGSIQAEPCTRCTTNKDKKMFVECIQWPHFYGGCCANCKWHDYGRKCTLAGNDGPAPAPGVLVQPPPGPSVDPPAIVQPPPMPPIPALPAPSNPFGGFSSPGFTVEDLFTPVVPRLPVFPDLGMRSVALDPVQNAEIVLPPPAPLIHGFRHAAENPTLLDHNGREALAPIIPVMGNIAGNLVQSPAVPIPPLVPGAGADADNPMGMLDQYGDFFEHGVMRGLPLYRDGVRLWDGQGDIRSIETARLVATFDELYSLRDDLSLLFDDASSDDGVVVKRYYDQGDLLALIKEERQRRLTA